MKIRITTEQDEFIRIAIEEANLALRRAFDNREPEDVRVSLHQKLDKSVPVDEFYKQLKTWSRIEFMEGKE